MAISQTLRLLALLCTIGLVGCLQQGTPLVADRSPQTQPTPVRAPVTRPRTVRPPPTPIPIKEVRTSNYVVRRGDTLYSIAWQFKLDHQGLAYANRIPAPYTIYPGQKLVLRAEIPPRRPVTRRPSQPVQPTVARSTPPAMPTKKPPAPIARGGLSPKWVWPTDYKASRGFSTSNKGVDFELPAGRKSGVSASNGGKIVYSGNGIGGFEQLIIIKHTEALLSAYSFNGASRVKEQEVVKVGQKIADILSVGRTAQKLHFEIRREGDPVNPGKFIK